MKIILIIVLLIQAIAFSQTEPVFGLDVHVQYLRTRKPVPNAPIIVSDTTGRILAEGCTDSEGSVSFDSRVIRPHAVYEVRIGKMEGWYESGTGTRIVTEGIETSERFTIDLAPLPLKECWFFSCYGLDEMSAEAQIDSAIADVIRYAPLFEQEYGIITSELAVRIHYETGDYEKELMKRARRLRRKMRKRLPGMVIDREIKVEYHPDHRHEACLQVVRLA